MKSNHQSNTTMPTKPYPKVPQLHVFLNISRDDDSTINQLSETRETKLLTWQLLYSTQT